MLFCTPGSFLVCLELAFRSRGLQAGQGLGTVLTPQEEVAPGLQLEQDKRGPVAAGGLWGHSGPPRSRAAPLGCGGSDRPALPPRPERCPALLQVAAPQLHLVGRALWSVSFWGSLGGRGGHTVAGSLAPSRGDPEKGKTSLLGQRRPGKHCLDPCIHDQNSGPQKQRPVAAGPVGP